MTLCCHKLEDLRVADTTKERIESSVYLLRKRAWSKCTISNGIKKHRIQWLIVDGKEMHCILEIKTSIKFAKTNERNS